jgi:glycerophosphoryl diester phosphodiesterase
MFRLIGGLVAVVLGLWIVLHLVQAAISRAKDRRTFVVGHRGAAGLAPENTIPAIEAGIDRGAQAIEVDVHRTQDGTLVVMHDASVARTTQGQGEIRDLTWDQIQELDAGRHFSSSYEGTPVPTLRHVIDRVLGAGRTLVVEVKDPALYPGIAEDLAVLLSEEVSPVSEDVVVISFDLAWLRQFHEVAPDVRLGQLHLWGGRWPRVGGTVAVDVYWRSAILDPTLIWRARRRGYRCWVWTVNRPWTARMLWWLGIEAVTTDYPDRIRTSR